jgi:hypothetical protein
MRQLSELQIRRIVIYKYKANYKSYYMGIGKYAMLFLTNQMVASKFQLNIYKNAKKKMK